MDKPIKKPAKVTPVKAIRITKNGGKLNSGGSWPNSGRPPSELRALAREHLAKDELIPHLAHLGRQAGREGDQIAAIRVLLGVAIPTQVDVGENPESPPMTDAERKERLKALLRG